MGLVLSHGVVHNTVMVPKTLSGIPRAELRRMMAAEKARANPSARKLAEARAYLQSVEQTDLAKAMAYLRQPITEQWTGRNGEPFTKYLGTEHDGIRNDVELAEAVRHLIAGMRLGQAMRTPEDEARNRAKWAEINAALERDSRRQQTRRAQNLRRKARLGVAEAAKERAKRNLWKAQDRVQKLHDELAELEREVADARSPVVYPRAAARLKKVKAESLPAAEATAAKWRAELASLSA